MRTIKFILMLLTSFQTVAQVTEPPKELWITDIEFERKINEKHPFGNNGNKPVLIEFWAEFNKENCFSSWNKVKDVVYYRVNIALAPETKKRYGIKMTPTLIIFKNGAKKKVWKAGLDLTIPTSLEEVQRAIDEVNAFSKRD